MAYGDKSDPIVVTQNDTRPIIRYYAKQGSGAAVNLAGSTVVFNMRLADPPQTLKANRQAATLVGDGTGGGMDYVLKSSEVNTVALLQAEFEVTFPDGGILTWPGGNPAAGQDYIYILVKDDIA